MSQHDKKRERKEEKVKKQKKRKQEYVIEYVDEDDTGEQILRECQVGTIT